MTDTESALGIYDLVSRKVDIQEYKDIIQITIKDKLFTTVTLATRKLQGAPTDGQIFSA